MALKVLVERWCIKMSSSKTTIYEIGNNLTVGDTGRVAILIPMASDPEVFKSNFGYITSKLNKTYDSNKEKYDKDNKALNFTLQFYPKEAKLLNRSVNNIYMPDGPEVSPSSPWRNEYKKLFQKNISSVYDATWTNLLPLDYKVFRVSSSTPVYGSKITNARMEWSGR